MDAATDFVNCETLMPNLNDRRFDWSCLTSVTPHLPATGGQVRSELDDFVVTEIPKYLPNGNGPHAYAFVEKGGYTTQELITSIKALGVSLRDIGVAGRKDKYAITRQWISVPSDFEQVFTALDRLDGVKVLEISRHQKKLGIGNLLGNRFEIVVRAPQNGWQVRAERILTFLVEHGLPNYFGPQRFGRFNSNIIDAFGLLEGKYVPGGRRLHKFFMSALQSHLFNWVLKSRIDAGLYSKVVEGDWAQKHSSGGMFQVEDAAKESERAAKLEISAALPMYGRKVSCSQGYAGELEQNILDRFGLSQHDLRSLGIGTWRISRVRVTEPSLAPFANGYKVSFTLTKGAFATSLLRELVNAEVS